MKIIKYLLFTFMLLVIPITLLAKTEYNDVLGPKINYQSDEITIYLFYQDGCSHCAAEKKFLKELNDKYPKLNIMYYEVNEYEEYYYIAQDVFDLSINSVPFTIVGEEYYLGFNSGGTVEENIKKQISYYYNDDNSDSKFEKEYKIPLLGSINAKAVSIPLVAIILGLVDGFNPCAMWILLFLLSILINTKNRKKMIIVGSVFLLSSAIIYFLSILGINIILNIKFILGLRVLLGIIAIGIGLYNVYLFFKNIKNTGCEVVNEPKRKKLFKRITKIINTENIIFMLISIILLAISVNLIEMVCSLGFPTIFSEIMALNGIKGIHRILLILLYVLFYMIDDIIVFLISVFSLKLIGTSNRVGKVVKIIAAIIMIIMGILLIFFPNIVMLNF